MKIVQQTPTLLKCRQRLNWLVLWVGLLPFGIGLIYAGTALAYLLLTETLTCRRIEPKVISCEQVIGDPFGLLPTRVNRIQRIGLNVTLDRETTQPWDLLTVNQQVGGFKSLADPLQVVQFINTTQPTITLPRSYDWLGVQRALVISLAFGIPGFLILRYASVSETLIFDKAKYQLTWKYPSFFGKTEAKWSLHEIVDIQVEEFQHSPKHSTRKAIIIFDSGQSRTLFEDAQGGSVREMARRIREFLEAG